MYLITAPRWLRMLYPRQLTWEIPVEKNEKHLYLTFDDGPHPIATPFVLDQLKKYSATGTFFCIGKNVMEHREVYQRIINEGHALGNHTHNHLNGWKTKDTEYIHNIQEAAEQIDSKLFRPPYGRITRFQARVLTGTENKSAAFRIIMWSVLSADWDQQLTGEQCYRNVLLNAKPGSIIVFHDSAKAYERLQYALPRVLAHFAQQGYSFRSIPKQ